MPILFKPARTIKRSAVKNICRFATSKTENGKSILTESILEKDFCFYLEFSNRVRLYGPQPETLDLVFSDGSTHEYTPDFKIIFIDGAVVYAEVKPASIANSEHYRELFSAAEKALLHRGIGFELFTEEFIMRRPLITNLQRLHRYRRESFFNKADLYQIASTIETPITLGQLIRFLDGIVKLQEIYSWIAFGFLRFSIELEVLSVDTEVTFHVE